MMRRSFSMTTSFAALALALGLVSARAEDMDHSKMDHSAHGAAAPTQWADPGKAQQSPAAEAPRAEAPKADEHAGHHGGGASGGMGGMMGGMGGMFGRTQSSVARQQEVTWVYNRTTKDAKGQTTAISYEFLINPGGSISQIRCLGYHSPIKPTTQTPSITTQKGIRLGSSYVEILRAYGQPDSYEKSGNILVLSYPKKHVQFQLINQKEQAEPTKAAYRVIAMTIATVEG